MSRNPTPTDKQWLDAQYQNGQIRKPNELEGELQDPPEEVDKTMLDRVHGSIAGMALGDALGAHVEFRPRDYLVKNPVEDLKGGGTWGLNKGEFTDDTSMALCLASSLVICRDFIPYDQLVRYKWWFRNGYMSATGKCFDIGAATKKSLIEFERRQRNFAQKKKISEDMDSLSDPQLLREFNVDCSNKEVAGNGALMRLAPVPLFFHNIPKVAVEFSGVSGRITHGDESAYDACRYYGALIVAALEGKKKSELLDDQFYIKNEELFSNKPLHSEIIRIAKGSYKKKKSGYDDGIRGKGYIVDALEAALWAFCFTEDFETGALAAVNLGDDADTTAAIYGQLAGAHYGFKQLPEKWLKYMYARRFIECLSKWIVFEGQKWQPERSVAVIINVPASQGQSNTTTNASAKQNRNANAQTTTSQRAGETKPESKQNKKTQLSNAATASNAQGYPNNGQFSEWEDRDSQEYGNSKHPNPTQYQDVGYAADGLQSCQDVSRWLRKFGEKYAPYADQFEEKIVDGFWLLNYVNNEILIQYGVQNPAHRERILKSIEGIKNDCIRKRSAK